jgi:TolB-like protein
VRRSPDRVRVTVQLIASESGDYLWSETYDDQLENVFVTQEHMARVILQELEKLRKAARNDGETAFRLL